MKIVLNKEVYALIRNQDISQSALAKKIGTTQPTISNYITGKSSLRLDHFYMVLKELGIDLGAVLKAALHKANSSSGRRLGTPSGLGQDIEQLLSGLEKTPRNAVLNTLLKVSSRLDSEDMVKARQGLQQFMKSQR